MSVDKKMAEIAVLSTTSVWSQLYFNAKLLSSPVDLDEIRDTTDILRWCYLGFSREEVTRKIKEAKQILENIPIQGIPLLGKGD